MVKSSDLNFNDVMYLAAFIEKWIWDFLVKLVLYCSLYI